MRRVVLIGNGRMLNSFGCRYVEQLYLADAGTYFQEGETFNCSQIRWSMKYIFVALYCGYGRLRQLEQSMLGC